MLEWLEEHVATAVLVLAFVHSVAAILLYTLVLRLARAVVDLARETRRARIDEGRPWLSLELVREGGAIELVLTNAGRGAARQIELVLDGMPAASMGFSRPIRLLPGGETVRMPVLAPIETASGLHGSLRYLDVSSRSYETPLEFERIEPLPLA